jgi:hypothetical protein
VKFEGSVLTACRVSRVSERSEETRLSSGARARGVRVGVYGSEKIVVERG